MNFDKYCKIITVLGKKKIQQQFSYEHIFDIELFKEDQDCLDLLKKALYQDIASTQI